jgi:hypothetical protein
MVELPTSMTLLDGENGISAMSRNSFMHVSTNGYLQFSPTTHGETNLSILQGVLEPMIFNISKQ